MGENNQRTSPGGSIFKQRGSLKGSREREAVADTIREYFPEPEAPRSWFGRDRRTRSAPGSRHGGRDLRDERPSDRLPGRQEMRPHTRTQSQGALRLLSGTKSG